MKKKQLVIYPGFHKTGTTTVTKYLRANLQKLGRGYFLPKRDDIQALRVSAVRYSSSLDPEELEVFGLNFVNLLIGFVESEYECLILSSEELCGHAPARANVRNFAAAPALLGKMATIIAEIDLFSSVDFYISLRHSESWLDSLYNLQVRALFISQSREEFIEEFREAANFAPLMRACAEAVSPFRFKSAYIEDLRAYPHGIITPFLDFLEISEEKRKELPAPIALNPSMAPGLLEELRKINAMPIAEVEKRQLKSQIEKKHKAQLRAKRRGEKSDD